MIYLIAAIVLLGVLITIHEFGHFIVARMCNIHVIRFSIGMGPVIYKKSDSKGTEYALSALPLGGYVAMLTSRGMEEDQSLKDSLTDEQQGMVFEAQPKLKRAAVMLAGPMANFILAIFILAVIYANSIQRTFITEITAINDPVIAQESVLQKGDVIAAINGKSISNLQDLRLELLSHSGSNDQIILQIERGLNNSFAYTLNLNNFLESTEAQESPEDYLGFDLELKIAPYIGGFSETSMAPNAGLKVNDKIVAINSQAIRTYEDIAEVMQSFSNSEVAIEVLRDGEPLTFMVPLLTQDIDGQTVNIIGITAGTQKSITESLLSGIYDIYTMSAKTLLFVGKMISGSMGV
jgi:regulator of sigma E protease